MERHYTKVTESLFNAAKLMLKGGAKQGEVAEFMKISRKTVSIISVSETYTEYKNNMYCTTAAYRKKEEAKKAETPDQIIEHRQSVTVQATHFMEMKLDKVIELLTILNNKLGFIVDELSGVKTGGKEL